DGRGNRRHRYLQHGRRHQSLDRERLPDGSLGMASAGGGGAPPIDFSNPVQALVTIVVVALVCYAAYRLFGSHPALIGATFLQKPGLSRHRKCGAAPRAKACIFVGCMLDWPS